MSSKRTIRSRVDVEIDPIKGSRFFGIACPASNRDEAIELLDQIRAEEPGATHHCWAWRLAEYDTRFSDDGEPHGSAGQPILRQIESHNLVATLVVVRRRFGGVKLGVGGLIRAYAAAAKAALESAEIIEQVAMCNIRIIHDYDATRLVEEVLADAGAELVESLFEVRVQRVVRIPLEDAERLLAAIRESGGGAIEAHRESEA